MLATPVTKTTRLLRIKSARCPAADWRIIRVGRTEEPAQPDFFVRGEQAAAVIAAGGIRRARRYSDGDVAVAGEVSVRVDGQYGHIFGLHICDVNSASIRRRLHSLWRDAASKLETERSKDLRGISGLLIDSECLDPLRVKHSDEKHVV